jgi:predicted alpha/beta hydrolase
VTQPTRLELTAEDGTVLAAQLYARDAAPRASVVIHPAVATPARYYEAFAEHLAARGLEVLTYDYRGVGRSRPASLRNFDATLSQWAELDAVAAARFATRDPARPFIAIGHSFGGQVALALPNAPTPTAAMLVAAQSGYWRGFDWPARLRMLALWHLAVPAVTGVFGYGPGFTGLGEDLPAGVMWQWRRWCLHPDYYFGEHPEFRARLLGYRGPLLAMSFTDDRFVPEAGARWLLDRLPHARAEHRRISPREAGLRSIDHFGFFRRSNAARLWPIATQYLDRVLDGTWIPRPDPLRIDAREVVEQLYSRAS